MRIARRHRFRREAALIKKYEVPCTVIIPVKTKTPTGDYQYEDAESKSVMCAVIDFSLHQVQQSGGLIGRDDQWVFSRVELPLNCILQTSEGKRYRIKPQGDYTRYGEHYEYHAVSESNAEKYYGAGEASNAWT